ncbi:MAG TPA: ABC transporter substrate-binding protein [Chloroflexota bacterium]
MWPRRGSPSPLHPVFAFVVALSLIVGACAPSAAPPEPTPATGQPTPSGTSAASPTTVSQPTAQPAAGGQPTALAKEQVIRIPSIEPPTLDPGLATDEPSLNIIAQLFEGLVTFDEQGNIRGVHAERWEPSPDGLTYTFTLRPNLKWSNGQPVTAHDYVWSWKRNLDPATGSRYASSLFPIKNARAIHEGRADLATLGVEAKDDRTLVVTLEQPAAYFLRLASTWTLFPLPRQAIEQHGDKWTEPENIVTNGPFKLASWEHNQEIVLERNEDYWGEKPRLQRAIFRIFSQNADEQILAAYENNEIDTTGIFGIPAAHVDRVLSDPKLKNEVKVYDSSGTFFITVNTRKPHLQDPRVRKALGMAIDRQAVIESVMRIAATPAYSVIPSGIMGRNPELWPRENVEQAKQLLAEAGYPNGQGFPEITFTYNTHPRWKAFAEYLQQRWQQTLGIKVKIEELEWQAFLEWRGTKQTAETFDLYRGGWVSDYEDPNNWYNMLWDSAESPLNSGWQREEYDRIVREARAALDPQQRATLYGQAEKILAEEYPIIPVYHYATRQLVKPWVQNWKPARVLAISSLAKVQVLER